VNPPVLAAPRKNHPPLEYISATFDFMGSLVAQENHEGYEQTVYYLSQILSEVERSYTQIEKLFLIL